MPHTFTVWCFIIMQISIWASQASAIVPKYYTDFDLTPNDEATLMEDLYAFLAQLCLNVPALPCAAQENITVVYASS